MADEEEKKDADDVATEEEVPKKGSKKLLIIGLLVGLLLGGGGGVGALMMLGGGEAHEEVEEVHEEEVVEEPKPDMRFVKINRVSIPLIYKNRVLGNMRIDFSLEVEGEENEVTVVGHLPEIRDALLRHYSNTPLGKKGNPRSVDYPRLKKNLKDISNKILHHPLILRVMIVQAQTF